MTHLAEEIAASAADIQEAATDIQEAAVEEAAEPTAPAASAAVGGDTILAQLEEAVAECRERIARLEMQQSSQDQSIEEVAREAELAQAEAEVAAAVSAIAIAEVQQEKEPTPVGNDIAVEPPAHSSEPKVIQGNWLERALVCQ